MDALVAQPVALAEQLVAQHSWQARSALVCYGALASALYLKLCVARHAPSFHSLLLVAPVVAFNFWAPLLFPLDPELIPRTACAFVLMWLGTFKAVGLCFGRGSLATSDWNIVQFVSLYVLPLYPRQDFGPMKAKKKADTDPRHLFVQFLANTGILCIVAFSLATFDLPRPVRHYVYALGLYGFVSFMMEGPAVLLIGLLGLQVTPVFDQPWLASSLGEFWSQRWNNNTSLMLRALVYEPFMDGRLMRSKMKQGGPLPPGKHSKQRSWKLAGMFATFAASGIMHEFILMYVGRPYIPGPWFTFFFLQAPLILAEIQVLKYLKVKDVHLPWLLRMCITISILLFTADRFFYPPVEDYTDTAERVVHAVLLNASLFRQWVSGLLQAVVERF